MEQISNMPLKNAQDPTTPMKKGDVQRAKIIERGDNNVAVVRMRGKNMKVQFEGGIPKEDNVSVEVTGKREDITQVRVAKASPAVPGSSSASKEEMSVTEILKQAGVEKPTPELLKAVKLMQKHDIPLTKESIRAVESFLSKSGGSPNEKMAAIHSAAIKNVRLTEQNLSHIREGLHSQSVAQLINEVRGQYQSEQELPAQLEKAIEAAIKQAGKKMADSELFIEQKTSSQNNLATALHNLSREIKSEPDVNRLLQQFTNMADALPQTNMREQLLSNIATAEQLVQSGKEMAARKLLNETLLTMEQKGETAIRDGGAAAEAYRGPGISESVQQVQSKQFLETRITDKLIQVADRFQSMKNDTRTSLDQTLRLLQSNNAAQQASQVIEGTIKQLDRAILKSDFIMYADMKTERNMMKASAQLGEAKQLLQNGNIQAARSIVEQVKQHVDTWKVQTSEQKVKHMVMGQLTKSASTTSMAGVNAAVQQTAEQAQLMRQEASARQVFELIRTLGLNRESEIGQMLTSSRRGDGEQTASQQQNLKESLIRLMKSDESGARVQQQAGQALSNLSGQQLLSKTDAPHMQQQLLFNLPIPLKEGEQFAQLQVYIQSRQNGGQMDWENCNLYFLIDTPALGETGISIHSLERQLSITLKNDQQAFADKMSPLVEKTVQSISELGYQIQDIKYQPLHKEEAKQQMEEVEKEKVETLPFYTEKGFDYKV